jgi:hypothetical protein
MKKVETGRPTVTWKDFSKDPDRHAYLKDPHH